MVDEQRVSEALSLINQIIPELDEAESKLKSARNWGFIDMFGGGFLTDLIKHSKISSASSRMNEVNYLMQRLQVCLQGISTADYTMQVRRYATFADFLFDGFIFDTYMTSKIMGSLDQVRELKSRLFRLKSELESKR